MIKQVVLFKDEERELYYRFNPIEQTIKVKKTKKGYTVKYLIQDLNPLSPDSDEDDEVFLVNYHRDFRVERNDIITEEEVIKWYNKEHIEPEKEYHIFMLSCLIHSGVWLSLDRSFTSDPGGWDTSHVGVILVKKTLAKGYKKALRMANSLIEEWNAYLSGDVYCLVKETYDNEKNPLEYEISCNYYHFEYAKEALKTNI